MRALSICLFIQLTCGLRFSDVQTGTLADFMEKGPKQVSYGDDHSEVSLNIERVPSGERLTIKTKNFKIAILREGAVVFPLSLQDDYDIQKLPENGEGAVELHGGEMIYLGSPGRKVTELPSIDQLMIMSFLNADQAALVETSGDTIDAVFFVEQEILPIAGHTEVEKGGLRQQKRPFNETDDTEQPMKRIRASAQDSDSPEGAVSHETSGRSAPITSTQILGSSKTTSTAKNKKLYSGRTMGVFGTSGTTLGRKNNNSPDNLAFTRIKRPSQLVTSDFHVNAQESDRRVYLERLSSTLGPKPGSMEAKVEMTINPDGKSAHVVASGGAAVIGIQGDTLCPWVEGNGIRSLTLQPGLRYVYDIPLERGLILAAVLPLTLATKFYDQTPYKLLGVFSSSADDDTKSAEDDAEARFKASLDTYEEYVDGFINSLTVKPALPGEYEDGRYDPSDKYFATFLIVDKGPEPVRRFKF